MANVEAAPSIAAPSTSAAEVNAPLLVTLASASSEQLGAILSNLAVAFAGNAVVVVSPDIDAPDTTSFPGLTLLPHGEGTPAPGSWFLTPQEYGSAHRNALTHGASACLLLGHESQSLQPEVLRSLAHTVLSGDADLCTPHYDLSPREGLVNSAMLYPLSRALYNAQPRYPLAIDMGCSLRMIERLSGAAQRISGNAQAEALLWPVSEAAAGNLRIVEVPGGTRTLPIPDVSDLNSLLAQIAGSLFADIEAKASFWQRSRPNQAPLTASPSTPGLDGPAETQPLIDSFRVAYTNLAEIWSLVIPPQSLLGLKKLAVLDPPSFRMPPSLWARILYDFVLAFRLRTLNRGHLLGALTPLYLAWVASHLLAIESGVPPEQHVEETAAALELEKPYFVSRWRWPDRFNP